MNNWKTNHDNMTETNYTSYNGVSVGTLLHISAQILLFSIGTFIQVKLICLSYKERGKCWQIYVVHSVVLIISFTFIIPFVAIMHFIPLLSQHVGYWVCYVASFITYYSFYSIAAHSLVISVMKYLQVVHFQKVRKWKETTLMHCIFIINLLHPLVFTISNIATSDWGSNTSLNSCFKKTAEESGKYNSSVDTIETPFLCAFQNSNSEDMDASYIFKRCLCFIRTIVNIVTSSNVIDGYFYFKIFNKMKR